MHLTSIRGHFLMCSAEVSKLKWSLQARHSPWKVESRWKTKIFLQKVVHLLATQVSWPVVFLNWVTQKPKKLCPYGVAMCASRIGFVLEKKQSTICAVFIFGGGQIEKSSVKSNLT